MATHMSVDHRCGNPGPLSWTLRGFGEIPLAGSSPSSLQARFERDHQGAEKSSPSPAWGDHSPSGHRGPGDELTLRPSVGTHPGE